MYYMGLYSQHKKVIASGIPASDLNRALIKMNIFYESMTYNYIAESININNF